MSLGVIVVDGKGRGFESEVTADREDTVMPTPWPPFRPQKVRPFRQYMTLDGTPTGDNDMGVDGSVNNLDFFIPAVSTYDRYITTLNFLVGYGTAGKPYLFADAAALTNGCQLFYTSLRGTVDIHEGLKSNQDFFRLSTDLMPTSWEVRHINALNDYGYILTMDLTKLGLSFGIKLDEGTQQKIVMCIKDNVTNADSFNVIAYGFERFE